MNPSILYVGYKYCDDVVAGWEYTPYFPVVGTRCYQFHTHHCQPCPPAFPWDPPSISEYAIHRTVALVPDIFRCGSKTVMIFSGRCECGTVLWTCPDLPLLIELCETKIKEERAKLGWRDGPIRRQIENRFNQTTPMPLEELQSEDRLSRPSVGPYQHIRPMTAVDDAEFARIFGEKAKAVEQAIKAASVAYTPIGTRNDALVRIVAQIRVIANRDDLDGMPEPDYIPRGN